jgi:hypothetical protein
MGGFFTNVLPFANILFDAKEKLEAAKKARREAVAIYCEKIAETSDEMLRLLQENKAPHGPLAKVAVYRQQFPGITGDLLPEQDITSLLYWSDTNQSAEEFLRDFRDSAYHEGMIAELSSASGTLRALAESLRAKK